MTENNQALAASDQELVAAAVAQGQSPGDLRLLLLIADYAKSQEGWVLGQLFEKEDPNAFQKGALAEQVIRECAHTFRADRGIYTINGIGPDDDSGPARNNDAFVFMVENSYFAASEEGGERRIHVTTKLLLKVAAYLGDKLGIQNRPLGLPATTGQPKLEG